jgi:polar amino acid transport system permease protein
MTKVKVIEWCVLAFVEYQRNVPPLVHIFLWYFGVSSILPESLQEIVNEYHGEFVFAAIAIGLYYGAYFAEDIRSGLRSIPKGQQEASRAIGLSYAGTMRRVILPQALRVAIPPLLSNTVMLVKTTSLAMVIGVMELTYATKEVASGTFRIFETYGISTAMYVVVALTLLFIGGWIGQRVRIKGR